jgi:hypothetical protein
MIARFTTPGRWTEANKLAKAALLLPSGPHPSALVRQFDDFVGAGHVGTSEGWHALLKGMAEYRSSNLEACVVWMAKAGKSLNRERYSAVATAELFSAMAHHRLGHADQARQAMDRAQRLIETQVPRLGGNVGQDGVENWLICHVARREAEKLIGVPAMR